MAKSETKHGKDALKRTTASVINKGSGPCVPQEPYIMDVGYSVFPRNDGSARTAWLAMEGKRRAQPHVKINEQDH